MSDGTGGGATAALVRGETPDLPIDPLALSRFATAPRAAEALTLHG